MQSLALVVLLAGWSLFDQLSMAHAQPSIMQQRDDTTGTPLPGLPPRTFNIPNRGMPGPVTPFGTPAPPNQITPAPLLPLQPRGMVTPQPQAPAPSGAPGGSGSFSGRSGR